MILLKRRNALLRSSSKTPDCEQVFVCLSTASQACPSTEHGADTARRRKFPLLTNIEERLSQWTQLPLSHQEDMQILRYAEGQKYGAHCT